MATNEGVLTAAVIKSIVTEEEYKILRKAYFAYGDISDIDIEKFQKDIQKQDKKRNILHCDLLAFAEKSMGKNDLQVFFDVLASERVDKGDLMVKGDNLYYLAGITSIEMGPRMVEFAMYEPNAEIDYAEEIKKAYEYFGKIKDGEWGYGHLRYESHLGKERKEAEDHEYFKTLFEEYKGYLSWEDNFFKYMHGDYMFSKRIRIDLNKIKTEHTDPKGFTEGIVDKIRNLVGNKKTYFLS